MRKKVVIVGGGPGGAATGIALNKRGIDNVIIERNPFPRYHIGESLTGECGNCVRSMGLEAEMMKSRYPVKWGVTVYGPESKNAFFVPVRALCPDTGKQMDTFTWQVRRAEYDKMLLDQATGRGSDFIQGDAVECLRHDDGTPRGVRVKTVEGSTVDVQGDVIVDASGLATWLSNQGVCSEKLRGTYDKQVAIFSQVVGGIRPDGKARDDTLIYYKKKYHWAWWIPLDDEVVSVGVVVPSDYYLSKKESKHDFLVRELQELNSGLSKRLPEIKLIEEVRAISNYSYEIKDWTGKGFLCVGDAHRFIDPVFSFGLYFATKEAQFAGQAIEDYLAGKDRDHKNPFEKYSMMCDGGMDVIQDLLDAFWDHPLAFSFFVHSRYTEDCIDMFAGRVYMNEPNPGLKAMRAIKTQGKQMNASDMVVCH